MKVGGGFDLRLGHHLAFRPIQASWLRTQFPNESTNTVGFKEYLQFLS
jgi:hypothetical protein